MSYESRRIMIDAEYQGTNQQKNESRDEKQQPLLENDEFGDQKGCFNQERKKEGRFDFLCFKNCDKPTLTISIVMVLFFIALSSFMLYNIINKKSD
mmetsp:Transcript_36556/g.41659  ORF Transcript_36556/g.41659 Transcript_36556/m.41659 type:complete len:96 (+) Transcript_36556:36-323(+)